MSCLRYPPPFDCINSIRWRENIEKVLSSFLLPNFLHSGVTSASSGQTIFFSTLFSNTFNPFFLFWTLSARYINHHIHVLTVRKFTSCSVWTDMEFDPKQRHTWEAVAWHCRTPPRGLPRCVLWFKLLTWTTQLIWRLFNDFQWNV
jgi:hypothetical protein